MVCMVWTMQTNGKPNRPKSKPFRHVNISHPNQFSHIQTNLLKPKTGMQTNAKPYPEFETPYLASKTPVSTTACKFSVTSQVTVCKYFIPIPIQFSNGQARVQSVP